MENGIHQVSSGVHLVEGADTNFLLLEDEGEVAFVDCGWPRDRTRVGWALSEIGYSFEDVRSVILTHAHADHLGTAEWMRREHGVATRLHPDDERLARGERKQGLSIKDIWRSWRPQIFRFTVNAMRRGGLSPEHLTEYTFFADDETLDLPGSPLVIHTPGHTDGHCSFHIPDAGVLISGDALVTMDLWDSSVEGPCVMRPPFHGDAELAWESLSKLEGVDAQVVVPGHGAVFHGTPAEAVARARMGRATG